jgi:CRISPR/Cas system CSM-associated protein Csm3 (group 7 of RAMP superfamily)
MHRHYAGSCTLRLRIMPLGGWMVRGLPDPNSERQVLQPLFDAHGLPYLPASSLKGVLRSTAERILRSVDPQRPDSLIPLADNPFIDRAGLSAEDYSKHLATRPRANISDSELLEWHAANQITPPTPIYPALSAASQLFGATVHGGMVTLDEAHAPKQLVRRSHVAIDRFSGGVGEGPFLEDLQAPSIPLETTLTITNFALYQLGLLAITLQELNRGYVGIGGGTRKGQGQVQIRVTDMHFRYAHRAAQEAGIVSAQYRLSQPPWNVHDVPIAVKHIEQGLTLLEDVAPASTSDWREQQLQHIRLNQTQREALFREAVLRAWGAWIDYVCGEGRV